MFTNNILYKKSYLEEDKTLIKCFAEVVVGSSKLTTWYQYGFYSPQGPIENKRVNGHYIREFSEWMHRQAHRNRHRNMYHMMHSKPVNVSVHLLLKLANDDTTHEYASKEPIVVLSRLNSRLIINEEELRSTLEAKFRLRVLFLRVESHPLEEQLDVLRHARVVMGMHGSMMALTMFCNPGTIVIELFPFAIPAENYTPYKTLAGMDGVDMVYRAWVVRSQLGHFNFMVN